MWHPTRGSHTVQINHTLGALPERTPGGLRRTPRDFWRTGWRTLADWRESADWRKGKSCGGRGHLGPGEVRRPLHVVHARHPRLEPRADRRGAPLVLRVRAAGEGERAVVREAHRLVVAVVPHAEDGEDRAEGLLLRDEHVLRHVGEHRRAEELAGVLVVRPPARQHPRPLGDRVVDEALARRGVPGRNGQLLRRLPQDPVLPAGLQGRPDPSAHPTVVPEARRVDAGAAVDEVAAERRPLPQPFDDARHRVAEGVV
eukprot:gene1984-biopygen509